MNEMKPPADTDWVIMDPAEARALREKAKKEGANWPIAFLLSVWSTCLTVLIMWWTK